MPELSSCRIQKTDKRRNIGKTCPCKDELVGIVQGGCGGIVYSSVFAAIELVLNIWFHPLRSSEWQGLTLVLSHCATIVFFSVFPACCEAAVGTGKENVVS